MLKTIALGVCALAAVGVAYVRLAPVDAAAWHVMPANAERTGKPNDYLVAEGGDMAPVVLDAPIARVATALEQIAMAEAGTATLAGAASEGFVTYVQRSRIMGYPDFISITLTAADDTTTVRMFSRSRDGHSDMGVNKARVARWLAALQAALAV